MAERVLLLHGFGAPNWCVNLLARRLRRYGVDARPWSYPSLTTPIDSVAESLLSHVETLESDEALHFVAHSMGSAIVRAMFDRLEPNRFTRFVFLSPPIVGTPLADWAPKFIQAAFPPLAQLGTDPDGYVRNLPLPPPERLAVIAGRFDLHVPLQWTRSPQIRNHLTLAVTHNGMLLSRRAATATAAFLRHGDLSYPLAGFSKEKYE